MSDQSKRALLTESEQLRARVRLLKEMAIQINSGLSVEQLVSRTLLEAHKTLPYVRISYGTADGGRVKVVSSVAPLNMRSIEGLELEIEEGEVLSAQLREGRPLAVTDITKDERLSFVREKARMSGAAAALLVPIRHPRRLLAFVSYSSAQPHEWSSYETEMLTDIAEHLAIALREAEMRRERERIDRQLSESQRMEAIGRLVGGVAHDFNNLLTGMMIYTGLLTSALGPKSPLLRHVREIQGAGERGAALVGQLLSMSRQHVLETRLLSLNDVVSQMREMLQRLVGEEVLIECHLAGDLPQTRSDENQLRQAILNLALNARDAMKTGGRLILTTQATAVDAVAAASVPGLVPGDYARLQVTDTGCGMSAETLSHCFEPFFTTKARGEGTGLGLAAVFGMTQQHGASIAVHSEPGRGTTFELYFPVADGVGPKAEPGARGTVLLVEDEGILRVPLAERLNQEGLQVLSAATPDGALQISRDHAGDIGLLVTDLVMPGMSGEELARRLELLRPGLRTLYISGYTDDPRARRLIARGANFLRKPFDSERFVQKVSELMALGPTALPARPEKNSSILGKET